MRIEQERKDPLFTYLSTTETDNVKTGVDFGYFDHRVRMKTHFEPNNS